MPPHHTRFHPRHYQFPTPIVFLLGLRVGSNRVAGGILLWLVLSSSSPRWPISNFRETRTQACLQLANYDVYPSWVGAGFLQHEVLIMTESLYAGLISVALFVSYSVALRTHPVKAHFSLLCLYSAPREICPRGTYGLGCGYGYGKPPSLPHSALECIQGTELTLIMCSALEHNLPPPPITLPGVIVFLMNARAKGGG